ncbi:MAG: hypothetical protein LBB53_00130, partial [Prevotellaceae bacterium]|nr:hypothetical protein [Prevotellaceae bacterium]
MKNVLKYTAVLTVVCCFGLSIFAQKNENSNGNRKNSNISVKIETLGNTQFISENEIINFLKNNKLYSEKMSVEKISTDRIITSLEKSFAVKNVSCYAAKSGVLVIKAEQRKPLFRVMGGSNFYIDVERKIFEIHK